MEYKLFLFCGSFDTGSHWMNKILIVNIFSHLLCMVFYFGKNVASNMPAHKLHITPWQWSGTQTANHLTENPACPPCLVHSNSLSYPWTFRPDRQTANHLTAVKFVCSTIPICLLTTEQCVVRTGALSERNKKWRVVLNVLIGRLLFSVCPNFEAATGIINMCRTLHHNSKLTINSLTLSHSVSPARKSQLLNSALTHCRVSPASSLLQRQRYARARGCGGACLQPTWTIRGRADPLPFLLDHIQVLSQ